MEFMYHYTVGKNYSLNLVMYLKADFFSTKYIGGHSDITAGCLSFCNKELYKKAHWYLVLLGSSLVRTIWYTGGALFSLFTSDSHQPIRLCYIEA